MEKSELTLNFLKNPSIENKEIKAFKIAIMSLLNGRQRNIDTINSNGQIIDDF